MLDNEIINKISGTGSTFFQRIQIPLNEGHHGPNIECWLGSSVIFQGIQTSTKCLKSCSLWGVKTILSLPPPPPDLRVSVVVFMSAHLLLNLLNECNEF